MAPHQVRQQRIYHFTRDSEDQLLNCKLKSTGEMAMVARVAKFYRPDELPTSEEESTTLNTLPGACKSYEGQETTRVLQSSE